MPLQKQNSRFCSWLKIAATWILYAKRARRLVYDKACDRAADERVLLM